MIDIFVIGQSCVAGPMSVRASKLFKSRCLVLAAWLMNFTTWTVSDCVCSVTNCTANSALEQTQNWAHRSILTVFQFMRLVFKLRFAVVLAKATKLCIVNMKYKNQKKLNSFFLNFFFHLNSSTVKRVLTFLTVDFFCEFWYVVARPVCERLIGIAIGDGIGAGAVTFPCKRYAKKMNKFSLKKPTHTKLNFNLFTI